MEAQKFFKLCHFPDVWSKNSLLSHEYLVNACKAFEKEYGTKIPTGGTEHWRFGAIIHKLEQKLNAEQLLLLLEAVVADPDRPMAGSAILEIAAQESANECILSAAILAVESSKEFCVRKSDLIECYKSKQGPYNIKP